MILSTAYLVVIHKCLEIVDGIREKVHGRLVLCNQVGALRCVFVCCDGVSDKCLLQVLHQDDDGIQVCHVVVLVSLLVVCKELDFLSTAIHQYLSYAPLYTCAAITSSRLRSSNALCIRVIVPSQSPRHLLARLLR